MLFGVLANRRTYLFGVFSVKADGTGAENAAKAGAVPQKKVPQRDPSAYRPVLAFNLAALTSISDCFLTSASPASRGPP